MHSLNYVLVLIALTITLSGCDNSERKANSAKSIENEEKLVLLGQRIYNDKNLSLMRNTSCSSCHQAKFGFADPRPVSVGTNGLSGTRNAPSLLGASKQTMFFWDGRQNDLNEVVLEAFTNPIEMGLDSSFQLIQRVKENEKYEELNRKDDKEILDVLRSALVAFIKSMPKDSSRYSIYRTKGQHDVFSSDELAGLQLFDGKAECSQCHVLKDGTLSDQSFHHAGVGFEAVAGNVSSIIAKLDLSKIKQIPLGHTILNDHQIAELGRFAVSGNANDIGAFKTPALRNVAHTAPYMHDGSIPNLNQAVDREIYYRGLNQGRPIVLTNNERAQLIAFLNTFSDE